jgi:hypothetical protein
MMFTTNGGRLDEYFAGLELQQKPTPRKDRVTFGTTRQAAKFPLMSAPH